MWKRARGTGYDAPAKSVNAPHTHPIHPPNTHLIHPPRPHCGTSRAGAQSLKSHPKHRLQPRRRVQIERREAGPSRGSQPGPPQKDTPPPPLLHPPPWTAPPVAAAAIPSQAHTKMLTCNCRVLQRHVGHAEGRGRGRAHQASHDDTGSTHPEVSVSQSGNHAPPPAAPAAAAPASHGPRPSPRPRSRRGGRCSGCSACRVGACCRGGRLGRWVVRSRCVCVGVGGGLMPPRQLRPRLSIAAVGPPPARQDCTASHPHTSRAACPRLYGGSRCAVRNVVYRAALLSACRPGRATQSPAPPPPTQTLRPLPRWTSCDAGAWRWSWRPSRAPPAWCCPAARGSRQTAC
jgi:hypothetical protein